MSKQDKNQQKRKKPVWPGGISPKAAGCGYLELAQPIYDKFHEKAARKDKDARDNKTGTPPRKGKKKQDDLPSPKAMGCGYLTLPDRPRR